MSKLVFVLILFAFASAAFGQGPATGLPPYGSFQNGQFDVVNLQNLNTTFGIPIVSTPGRHLPFNLALRYNSSFWQPSGGAWVPSPSSNFGWTILPIGATNYVDNYQDESYWTTDDFGQPIYCNAYHDQVANYTYVDPQGTLHSFPSIVLNIWDDDCMGTYNLSGTYTGYASDGTGYYMNITNPNFYSPIVTDRNGIVMQGTLTDRNGNVIGWGSSGTWLDSAGVTPFTYGSNSAGTEWDYKDANGNKQAVVLKYQNYSVATNFGCAGVVEYTQTVSLPYEMDLPNGQKYLFGYETTPGNQNAYTGRLTEIVLPTGGAIQYQYAGTNDSINCADGTITSVQRKLSSDLNTWNTWQYARSAISGQAGTTTITTPLSDQTVYTFNSSAQETSEKYYHGSATGTPLRTVTVSWASNGSPQAKTFALENGGTAFTSSFSFDSFGNLNSVTESTGSISRTTTYTYVTSSAYTSRNILSLLASKTVKDQSNNTLLTESITYDGATPSCITGAAQHDDTHYGCSFNVRGNPTQITLGTIATTSYSYDTLGNLLTAKDSLSHTTTFAYTDSWANQACSPSASSYSQLTSISDALSHQTTMKYFPCISQTATITDPNGQTTSFAYDAMKRLAQTNYPDGGVTTNSYTEPAAPSPTNPVMFATNSAIDVSRNRVQTTVFDGLGRPVQAQLNSASPSDCVETSYDALGRVSSTTNPHRCDGTASPTDGTTTVVYDALGRTTSVTDPDGSVATTSYSLNCATTTDEAGKQRESCTDGFGRLAQVFEDPNGAHYETDYTYDLLDNLTQVNQKGNVNSGPARTRSFWYDGLSRLITSVTPESGATGYSYLTAGGSFCAGDPSQICTRTDARGIVTTYAYDALNRLTQKSYSDGVTPTATFAYDAATAGGVSLTNTVGRMIQSSVNTGGVESIYSYDPMGRVLKHYQNTPKDTWQLFQLSYGYDLAGDMSSFTDADGITITYGYNNAGQVTSVTSSLTDNADPTALAQNLDYNPAGLRTQMTLGNGLTEARAYNNRLQPCRINVNAALGALLHCSDGTPSGNILDLSAGFNYGAGDNGSVSSWSAQGQSSFSRTYSYDFLNRLSGMSASGDYTGCFGLQWSYDAYGNRTSQSTTPNTGGSCPNFTASFSQSTNRMDNHSYDAAGNLLNDGTHSYFYDAENRLIQVDGTSGNCSTASACYTYDAEGRRVETNYGSYQIDQIYDEAGNITDEWYYNPNSFIWFYDHRVFIGRQLLATYGNGSVYFTHPDHLGSARMISDVHGNAYEWMDYFPFGEIAYHGGTSFTNSYFTGDTHDWESNLDHALLRQYGSPMARWTSPDPLGGSTSDPQSLNRYSYVLNNPLALTDALGAAPCDADQGTGSCPSLMDDGGGDGVTGFPGCAIDGISTSCAWVNQLVAQGDAAQCPYNNCVGIKFQNVMSGGALTVYLKGFVLPFSVSGAVAVDPYGVDTGGAMQGITWEGNLEIAQYADDHSFLAQMNQSAQARSIIRGTAVVVSPAGIGAWYGAPLAGFAITYAAPLIPPALELVQVAGFACMLADGCRDNLVEFGQGVATEVLKGLEGAQADWDDGSMPRSASGWGWFIWGKIHD